MTELAKEYGEGLFELAREENLLDTVHEEMNALLEIFRTEARFVKLMDNHSLPKAERHAVLEETFRGRVHTYVLNFMMILLDRGAFDAFSDCAKHFHERYCEEKGLVEARVTTASPLTDDQRSALEKKLGELSGKKPLLLVTVDPAVMGGLRVDMDGRRYDNTIEHRLDLMRRRLTDDASGKEG